MENWSEEHQRPFYYNQVVIVPVLSAQLLRKRSWTAPAAVLLQSGSAASLVLEHIYYCF